MYSVPLLPSVSSFTWWRSSPKSHFCISKENEEEVVLVDGDEDLSHSGSVSDVVTQEDDVVWRTETRKRHFKKQQEHRQIRSGDSGVCSY